MSMINREEYESVQKRIVEIACRLELENAMKERKIARLEAAIADGDKKLAGSQMEVNTCCEFIISYHEMSCHVMS